MGTGEYFINKTTMVYALRSRIDNWDLINLQTFCKTKDTNQNSNQHIVKKSPTFNIELISKIYKEFKQLVSRQPNNPIKNGIKR